MADLKKIDGILVELEKDVQDIRQIQLIAQKLVELSKLTFDIQGDISKEKESIYALISQEEKIRIDVQNSLNKVDAILNTITRIDNTITGKLIEFTALLDVQNTQRSAEIKQLFEEQKEESKKHHNILQKSIFWVTTLTLFSLGTGLVCLFFLNKG